MVDNLISTAESHRRLVDDPIVQDIQRRFGGEATLAAVTMLFDFFPRTPVTIGDSWQRASENVLGFPYAIDIEFRLKDRADRVAKIDFVGHMNDAHTGSIVQLGSLILDYDFKGRRQGNINVDESTGLVREMHIESDIDGTVSITGLPNREEIIRPIMIRGETSVTCSERQSIIGKGSQSSQESEQYDGGK